MQVQGLFRRTAWRMDLFGNIYIGIHTKAPRGLSLGRFCVVVLVLRGAIGVYTPWFF